MLKLHTVEQRKSELSYYVYFAPIRAGVLPQFRVLLMRNARGFWTDFFPHITKKRKMKYAAIIKTFV